MQLEPELGLGPGALVALYVELLECGVRLKAASYLRNGTDRLRSSPNPPLLRQLRSRRDCLLRFATPQTSPAEELMGHGHPWIVVARILARGVHLAALLAIALL